MTQNGLIKCHERSTVLCLGLIEGRFQSTSSKPAKSVTRGTETDPKQVRFRFICTFFLFVGGGGDGGRWGKEEVLSSLYYYMRNFCNLIGLE